MTTLSMNCGPKVPSENSSRTTDIDAVAEAVFVYEMIHRPLKNGYQTYFLYVENKQDAAADLIRRLENKKYPVKPASKATVSRGLVEDRETKKKGILLGIRHRKCTVAEHCEVEGDVYEDSNNTEGWRYQVAKEGNLWVVKKAEMLSIS